MDTRRFARLVVAALPFLLASKCFFGYSSGDETPPPTPPNAYVGIDQYAEKVEANSITLQGQAECPGCFASDWQYGSCPVIDCPTAAGLDISWTNHATEASGPATHGIFMACNCPIFSYGYCYSACRHVWSATVPLGFGTNDVEVSIVGSGFAPGSDFALVKRVPVAPTWLPATPGPGQVTLNWTPVSEATSYNVYWSTTQYGWSSLMTQITGVTPPFLHTGLASGVPVYYYVTALVGDAESFDSLQLAVTSE